MTVVAFVDETFRDPHTDPGYYQLTAALVDPSDLAVCRSALAKVAPARGFHASDLAAAGDTPTVEDMLTQISNAVGWNLVTVIATAGPGQGQNMEQYRQACLQALLLDLEQQHCRTITLDSRLDTRPGKNPEARNNHDRRTFARLRTTGQLSTLSRIHHSQNETLLWAPDAVGWAYRQYRLRNNPLYWKLVDGVTTVHDLGVL